MSMAMEINEKILEVLLAEAALSPRLRKNFDMRNSEKDTSQRMLNALCPGTDVPIHCHKDTSETVFCLKGRLEEIIYEEIDQESTEKGIFKEVKRIMLAPSEGKYGMQIPLGTWHSINVIEPSVIFEAKDGMYQKQN